MNKIKFYLLGKKGYKVLEGLINGGYKNFIYEVIIGKDLNIENDYSCEIEKICKKYNIKYFYRKDYTEKIDGYYKISIGWRWIIEQYDKLIVLHDSMLPKYRGFAPLVNALINGEKKVGVTAIFATKEYDRGDIISFRELEISYPKKINDLIEEISELYIKVVKEIVEKIKFSIKLDGKKQIENQSTYSIWRDEEDYFIDWKDTARNIKRFVDAVGYPYKGAKCYFEEEKLIIKEVEEVQDVKIENRKKHIGKVIYFVEEKPVIICLKGLLKINEAYYEKNKNSIFPLKKFRIRLK